MRVDITLLGRFTVAVDGEAVPDDAWSRRSAAELVQLLALAPSHRLHREQVMDALWPDVDLDAAATRLHKAAHFARRALGAAEGIVLARETAALCPGAEVRVDVLAFEAAATRAAESGDEAAVAAALELYGGELLPQSPYESWTFTARQRAQLLHRELLRRASKWAELVALDPTDEEAHLGVMQRLLAAGDRAGARRQFEALARVLEEELGIGPSAEAVALHARALEADRAATVAHSPRHSDLATQSIRFCTTPDGVRLAYAVSGDGPPLVKASNWLTHLDYDWESPVWRHWWQGLSRAHRLVRYDERGCGLSSWDVDDFTLEAYVRDLETVVDVLGLERFPLLGISQGGAIATTYAARHPERVTRLVLYGTGTRGRWVKAGTDDERAALRGLEDLMRVSWGTDRPGFHTVYNAMFMPDGPLDQWQAFTELQKHTASPENAVRLWTSFQHFDVTETAASLHVPTLVLHSRDELARPYADAVALSETIAGSRLVTLDSRNHILQAAEPAFARFCEEVEAFLAA